jgi:hypothetical protein
MNKKSYFYAIALANLALTSTYTMDPEMTVAPSLSHYEQAGHQLLHEIDALLALPESTPEQTASDVKTLIQSYDARFLWEDPRESFWRDPDFTTALLAKFFRRFQSFVPDGINATIILDRPEVYQLVAYEMMNNPTTLERVKEKLRTIAREFIRENKPIEQSRISQNKINFMNFMLEHVLSPNLLFKSNPEQGKNFDPLISSIGENNLYATAYFLEKGADPNLLINLNGKIITPFTLIVRYVLTQEAITDKDSAHIISLMLNKGAAVDSVAILSHQLMAHLGLASFADEPISLFLSAGLAAADTPLMHQKALDFIHLLLEFGFKPNSIYKDKTILQWFQDAYMTYEVRASKETNPTQQAQLENTLGYLAQILRLLMHYASELSVPQQLRGRELYGM